MAARVFNRYCVLVFPIQTRRKNMKYLAILALLLNLSAANAYDNSVKMKFSGTSGGSPINLLIPGTSIGEDTFAGNGSLGAFTLRNVRAMYLTPDSSGTCPSATQTYFTEPSGAGVLRSQDGSLLNLNVTKGYDCVDFTANVAHCVLTFQIISGTGRFKGASGTLTMTETVAPVLSDATGNPVFFSATGEITGPISGVAWEGSSQNEPQ
jgi:hypothetical protein